MAATLGGMWKPLVVLAITASVLTGCAGTPTAWADKCGGTKAGITTRGETLEYDQDVDSTGNAWTCLLEQAIPKKAVRYAITQDMTPGDTGMAFVDNTSIVYGVKESGAVILTVIPVE